MPKASQPLRVIDDEFNKWAVYREIEFLHARINSLLVSGISSLEAGLKEDYATGELDSEAKIIAALNATNSKINEVAAALNLVIAKVQLE